LGGWYIDRKYLKIEESHWLVNGLVSLAIGQLIFRFDISTFEGEGHAPARSLLVELEHYLLRGVEAVAADGVLTAVRDLSLPELEQLAFDIFQTELLTDESLPGATKVQISKELDDAAQALADPPSRTQGRSRLIGFCVGAIRQRRLTFEFSKDLRVASSPRDGAGANSH